MSVKIIQGDCREDSGNTRKRRNDDVDFARPTILSLCAGIGMLEEGIALAWEHSCGVRPMLAGVCEWEAYAEAVQVARMEGTELESAPIFAGDLATFPADRFAGLVDIISAGFPCPPVSCAGQRKGTEDERWIWSAIAGLIRTIQPRWVVLENVAGLLSGNDGRAFGSILRDLAEMGFDAEWGSITAAAVGASHKRERVFVLAMAQDSASVGRRGRSDGDTSGNDGQVQDAGLCGELAHTEHTERRAKQSETITECGRGGLGRGGGTVAEPAGGQSGQSSQSEGREDSGRTSETLADAPLVRLQGRGPEYAGERIPRQSERELFAPSPADPRWADIIRETPWLAPAVEPGLRELVTGQPGMVVDASRTDQLRCLGNQVVALQSAAILIELLRRIVCYAPKGEQ